MLKTAIIGLGAMGKGHLDIQLRLEEEGYPLKVVALADVDKNKFVNSESKHNIKGVGDKQVDFSKFHCYTDIKQMLETEELDMVTIALPNFLHCEYVCMALECGVNVLCEKPMAPTLAECQKMIDTAKRTGKELMIAHVVRFGEKYSIIKKYVKEGILGDLLSAYFFRGSDTPTHSHQGWQIDRKRGGGAHMDQHIHDTDMVVDLFGTPNAVVSQGKIHFEGGGYDSISTTYFYDHCRPIIANNDWMLKGSEFFATSRIEFVNGTVTNDQTGFHIVTRDGKDITPEYTEEDGYYLETKYFADVLLGKFKNIDNAPESSMETIRVALAEERSCDENSSFVHLK